MLKTTLRLGTLALCTAVAAPRAQAGNASKPALPLVVLELFTSEG